jgi:hypothetical protein
MPALKKKSRLADDQAPNRILGMQARIDQADSHMDRSPHKIQER